MQAAVDGQSAANSAGWPAARRDLLALDAGELERGEPALGGGGQDVDLHHPARRRPPPSARRSSSVPRPRPRVPGTTASERSSPVPAVQLQPDAAHQPSALPGQQERLRPLADVGGGEGCGAEQLLQRRAGRRGRRVGMAVELHGARIAGRRSARQDRPARHLRPVRGPAARSPNLATRLDSSLRRPRHARPRPHPDRPRPARHRRGHRRAHRPPRRQLAREPDGPPGRQVRRHPAHRGGGRPGGGALGGAAGARAGRAQAHHRGRAPPARRPPAPASWCWS